MWHDISPWLDKFLPVSVIVVKTLGRLGRFYSSEFNFDGRIEDRNDS